MKRWSEKAKGFLNAVSDPASGGARSVPGGDVTLYGTCYANLAKSYLFVLRALPGKTREFLTRYQDPETGWMVGPELKGYVLRPTAAHNLEHLTLHLTCATLGACQHFGVPARYPLRGAHKFCDLDYLTNWLQSRNLRDAWFEGNNIFFVGQLLVYLRDVEANPQAQMALDRWFEWLDAEVDPHTGLWGTDKYCKTAHAVYGGYHQLLVHFHEHHPLPNPKALIDIILGLQHTDGGFNPQGNAGACEDVDCVDILVNLYKRFDYRHPEIRNSLKKCTNHILAMQNEDGGFPYNRHRPQSHMGVPSTKAAPNTSTTFATWFRVHTLALCAEIVPEHKPLKGQDFGFSKSLSMGWHASPHSWRPGAGIDQKLIENLLILKPNWSQLRRNGRRFGGRLLRNVGLRA